MRRSLPFMLCLSLLLVSCKAKELVEKADISSDLQKVGTTDLMKQVADDQYTPPKDGRLTEAQVQMYLKVREHEKKIAEVAKEEMQKHADQAKQSGEKSLAGMMEGFKALGSVADFMTADIRAAKDLGFNTQEYLWIKGQILAVSTAAMAEKFNQTIKANFDQAYEQLKKAHDEATDEQTKQMYAGMLASYEKTGQQQPAETTEDPTVAYNRQLLTKYENALNAYAHELSKYEGKEGEIQQTPPQEQ